MRFEQKIVLYHISNMEKFAVKLFPQHSTFFSLNTKDCKILTHIKKLCLQNHLNWLGIRLWPNENAKDFIDYQTHVEEPNKFIARILTAEKAFLYADLFEKSPLNTLSKILLDLTRQCKKPTMILYNASETVDDYTQNSLNTWALEKYVIVDIDNNINIVLLLNYKNNQNKIMSPGNTAPNRQRISRKADRWEKNFSVLSREEQDFILMKLLSYFVKAR